MTNGELNSRLREGDHKAFYVVYTRFNKSLYHFSRKFVQDEDLIEDIIHDTFLNLWNARERISDDYRVESYLFRIARNLIYKHLRAMLKTAELVSDLSAIDIQKSTHSCPEHAVLTEEYDNIYELAVDRLPPQRKRIFVLSREKGLSHKEIAQFLQISPNTVKEHMSLAIKSIRDYIAKEHDVILNILLFLFVLG